MITATLTRWQLFIIASTLLSNAYPRLCNVGEELDVSTSQHVDDAKVVDEDLQKHDSPMQPIGFVERAVEEAVGDTLRHRVRRHGIVFRMIDDSKPRSKK